MTKVRPTRLFRLALVASITMLIVAFAPAANAAPGPVL